MLLKKPDPQHNETHTRLLEDGKSFALGLSAITCQRIINSSNTMVQLALFCACPPAC